MGYRRWTLKMRWYWSCRDGSVGNSRPEDLSARPQDLVKPNAATRGLQSHCRFTERWKAEAERTLDTPGPIILAHTVKRPWLTQEKSRTDAQTLSFVLHMCTMTWVWLCPHTWTHTQYCRRKQSLRRCQLLPTDACSRILALSAEQLFLYSAYLPGSNRTHIHTGPFPTTCNDLFLWEDTEPT